MTYNVFSTLNLTQSQSLGVECTGHTPIIGPPTNVSDLRYVAPFRNQSDWKVMVDNLGQISYFLTL